MAETTTNQWTLTDEHRAQIPAWNERWIAIARSTDPIDLKLLAPAIRGLYKAAELDQPRLVHCWSAMQGAYARAAAMVFHNHGKPRDDHQAALAEVRPATALGRSTRDVIVNACLQAIDADPVMTERPIPAEITGKLSTVFEEAAVATMLALVAGDKEKLVEEFKKALPDWWTDMNGGSEWASWCCHLSFVRDVVGWSHPTHVNYKFYEDACLHGGPRLLRPEFCLLCERAATRHIDQQGRLHNETGPAVSWHCGCGGWYIEGVRVPKKVVLHPEEQTLEEVLNEGNNEVARVRVERYGWERFLIGTGATQIHKRFRERDRQWETLYTLTQGTMKGQQRLLVTDPSTGRKYALPLPPAQQFKTCDEAQNWLSHGLDELMEDRG